MVDTNQTPQGGGQSPVSQVIATEPLAEKITHFGKRILIVEDEESLARALNLKLTASGYKVTIATDGQVGLDTVIAANAEGSEPFDLILLDLILPVMDGFSVLAKLGEHGNKTPVIVLSNLNQEEDIAKVKALGALDFLVKSNIQLSKIIEYLNRIL